MSEPTDTTEPTPRSSRRPLCGVTAVLGLSVVLLGAIGLAVLWRPPQDWSLLNQVVSLLGTLMTTLAGGLLGVSMPGRGPTR